ncbi:MULTISPECIES: hypothetical protein [Xenorhabdus]|uniref:Uncharacterized protein n=1 Tax=Xenorhabdus ehlersii TaxID=290111 RepID=A0A2D0IMI5_9GAMM|nr:MULTISPECIES: hypothetical protein [Xenorhabdus]MBC8949346.1 hypothetical protein [Xenorhabdus sp. TS4]PHM22988.1 hypothetical protein Xehl_03222 [Xenorhabdus ehlersii]RKE92656.1 hypothetical protein BDE27_0312 [Xenorhabdus ehlersii]
MRYYKQYPVTLEHYLDNPAWAVIAGYDYTFGDVICFQVNAFLGTIKYVFSRDGLDDFLDYQIRELPEFIAKLIGFLLLIVLYPTSFWLFAIIQMNYHKSTREKYRNGLPDDVNNHIIYWLRRFKK